MAGFFSPNCSRLPTLLQTLRRVPFVIEDTFSMGDFTPVIDWNGMTAADVMITRCRYLKIWNLFWFSIDIYATLSGAFSNAITVGIPFTAAGEYSSIFYNRQGGGAYVWNNTTSDSGTWNIASQSSNIVFRRTGNANWAAGVGRITANGFIEVVTNG